MWCLRLSFQWIGHLVGFCLRGRTVASLGWAMSMAIGQGQSPLLPGPSDREAKIRQAAESTASNTMEGYFQPSLSMMERADFLLSPAILVQQAISRATNTARLDFEDICFDAVIESAPIFPAKRVLLFAEYRVSKHSYCVKISWAEPRGRSLVFPVYPVGLSIVSDAEAFRIGQEEFPQKNRSFSLPVGERGVFRFRYGDYPLANIRFAQSEMREFFKTMDLSCGDAEACIIEQVSPERSIEVGFNGNGIKIGLGGVTNWFRELPMRFPQGGRRVTIKSGPVDLDKSSIAMPERIEVYHAGNGRLFRSATLTHFRYVAANRPSMCQVSSLSATNLFLEYRDVLTKYWKYDSQQLTKQEIASIVSLRERLRADNSGEDLSSIRRLRGLTAHLELSRLLDDQKAVSDDFRNYLRILTKKELPDVVLTSGYDVIASSVLWGRYNEANELLDLWLGAAEKIKDLRVISQFAKENLHKKDFWAVSQVLNRVAAKSKIPNGTRFEFEASRFFAVMQIKDQLRDGIKIDAYSKAQLAWISSTTNPKQIDRLLVKSKSHASDLFSKIDRPSKAQTELAARLAAMNLSIE